MQGPCRNARLAGGKYELVEEIGRGGMGTVWRAHALLLDRPCAIKFLKPETADSVANRERFVGEAKLAARLRTPHTVTIFDVDFMDGLPFIAMELLPGESLERRLDRGPLSPRLTCQLIRQVALGLSAAHAVELVHRDLKPDNVFVVEEDPLLVKILDFGVAKDVSVNAAFRTVTGAIIGTPHYMSPEQAMAKPVAASCDLWALGVLTYRCLTGELPFDGDTWPEVLLKIMHGDIPPLASDRVALPRAADRWWKRTMQRDPEARPASALDFASGLEEALAGAREERADRRAPSESAIRRRSGEQEPIAIPRRRTFAWVLALIALVGAAYGASAYWFASAKLPGAVTPVTQPPREDPAPGPNTPVLAGPEPTPSPIVEPTPPSVPEPAPSSLAVGVLPPPVAGAPAPDVLAGPAHPKPKPKPKVAKPKVDPTWGF